MRERHCVITVRRPRRQRRSGKFPEWEVGERSGAGIWVRLGALNELIERDRSSRWSRGAFGGREVYTGRRGAEGAPAAPFPPASPPCAMSRGAGRGRASWLTRPRRTRPGANRGFSNRAAHWETFFHAEVCPQEELRGTQAPAQPWQRGAAGRNKFSGERPWVGTLPLFCHPDSERDSDSVRLNFQRLSLAGQNREEEILSIFRQLREGETRTVHDLARRLRTQKKEVNRALYKLLREGKLRRSEETPPLWSIAGRERSPADRREEREARGDANPAMAETKDKICSYLFSVEETTALNLAKNIGFSRAKDVNAFLSALEKLGDVHKQNTNPPRWALTDRKRERMQMKLKASAVTQTPNPPESVPPCPRVAVASPAATASRDGSVENGQRVLGQTDQSDGSDVEAALPEDVKPQFSHYDNAENGQWATDDIPDNLNAINKQPDGAEFIGNSQSSPSYAAQFETGFPSMPVEKLLACQEKNPVSGLTEYSQYTSQQCEFTMLEQSGPSHEPRFKFQAVIGGRRFPPAEAGSKKLAKQEAAANAMKVLMSEAENGRRGGIKREEPFPSDSSAAEPAEPEAPSAPAHLSLPPGKHPISVLMEYGQKSGSTVEFELLAQEGPPHDPRFSYCVKMGSFRRVCTPCLARTAHREAPW
ncbi:double-stranded RNA-specific adenosine deaminase isoform B [Patagioenas fasciata monilis]|uniref:Double-stranded RNA-specific adenosine deaminase isoform B n=1 Tax=Patagioenas fasciata monilis TaxID=372326 RepID=A0A1V4JZR8_PATFA|nr:double-stranded RNA-specific adenosine deaminase isoform B [Patagioenas fasciata monilis]